MPELHFQVSGCRPEPFAAGPSLVLALEIENRCELEEEISSLALQCQLRILPPARRYSDAEQAGLVELFGDAPRWGRSMPPSFLWTHTQKGVPAFRGRTTVQLPVACTYDFNVAATKYFHALQEGEVPVLALFSGTAFFHAPDDGELTVAPIPWAKEVRFQLPVSLWKELMDQYYPNSAVLRVRRDLFDRLQQVKAERGLSTYDDALESLLPGGILRGRGAA